METRCSYCGEMLIACRRELRCPEMCGTYCRATHSLITRVRIAQDKELGTWKKTPGRPRKKLKIFGEEIELDRLVCDPRCKVGRNTLLARLKRGWTLYEAVTTPKIKPGIYLGK